MGSHSGEAMTDLPAPGEVTALLVAGGRGERLGSRTPKALVPVAGRPMLSWSLDALLAAGVREVVLAAPAGAEVRAVPGQDEYEGVQLFDLEAEPGKPHAGKPRWRPLTLPEDVLVVAGGVERSHSVRAALASSTGDPVIVHDAARPLTTPTLVAQCLAALARDPELAGVIAAAPVTDTIKRATDGMHVDETLRRSELWAVQTPQVFRREWLERALSQPDHVLAAATDDASIIEALGGKIGLVVSGPGNLKVTTPHDLRVAELLLKERT